MANEDLVATHSAGVADTLQAGGSSDPMRSSPGSGRHSIELVEGTVLDGVYKVIRRIGGGAMGTVYLVEHQQLGRQFAAKVVAAAHSTDLEIVARLRNEARVASSIQHENIVDVTHLGRTPEGLLFVVMELLQGCDLRHRLTEREKNNASPWLADDETRRIARDVLTGLHAAHEAGIIHRDLKPDNIFLSTKGATERAKIVDFGISKGARAPDASDMRLTRTGQIIGTPLYMAPEQARGIEGIDRRADLYAIGVILYEMTTGRLPFEATSIYDLIVKHATEIPAGARTRRPDLPEAVERVITRCLEKLPEDRYQTAKELLEAWEKSWSASAPSTPPPAIRSTTSLAPTSLAPPASDNRPMWIGALVLLLVLAAVGVAGSGVLGGDPPPSTVIPSTVIAAPPSSVAPTTVISIPDPPPTTVGVEVPADVHRTLVTDPPGASVEVGGVVVGTTPFDLTLMQGNTTEVTLRMSGRRPITRTIAVSDPETVTVELERTAGRPHPPQSGLPQLAPH